MTNQRQRDGSDGDQPHDDDGRSGGEAEAAGSVEEREAVALDDDQTWDPKT